MRILVVEDDLDLREPLVAVLRAAGFAVDVCGDVVGADVKLTINGYDAAVLDRRLPAREPEMRVGVMMHVTDRTVSPVTLAVEAEARGFDSVFVTEHTHIPVREFIAFRGGAPLPEEYKRLHDPLIALAAAAGATTTIRLGTGVLVVGQREPLATAKQLASLDQLSGGRLVVGTGYGWLTDELARTASCGTSAGRCGASTSARYAPCGPRTKPASVAST